LTFNVRRSLVLDATRTSKKTRELGYLPPLPTASQFLVPTRATTHSPQTFVVNPHLSLQIRLGLKYSSTSGNCTQCRLRSNRSFANTRTTYTTAKMGSDRSESLGSSAMEEDEDDLYNDNDAAPASQPALDEHTPEDDDAPAADDEEGELDSDSDSVRDYVS